MPDAWRAYLEMALGLTESPRKKAQQVAGDLVNRGGATAAQLQGLVDDLLQSGMANREALTNIVRYEVDRALGVVGLATADEVSELTTRVRDLEKQLREAQARATATLVPGSAPSKAVARKAIAKKVAGASAVPIPPVAVPPAPVAKKAVAKKAVAKKAIAKKAVAKKAVAKAVAESAPIPAPAVAAAPDVLTESIGDDLTAAQRAALQAAVGETPTVVPTPAKNAVAKKTAQSAPAEASPEQAPAQKSPAKKTTPAAKAAPATKAAPAAKASPATKAAPAAKASPATNGAPAVKAGPVKKARAAKKVAPTKAAPTTTPEA